MIEDIFYYTHNKFKPQVNIHTHKIRFHELTFLLEGKMTYCVDDEVFEMKSGDIIYLPAGSMRQRDVCDGKNNYVSINFHTMEDLPLRHYYSGIINEEIIMLIEYMDKIYASPSDMNPKKLIHILEVLILQISDNVMIGGKPTLASEIANYLTKNYQKNVTLEDISQATFFSVAYCESEFRKAFGKSIIHYLIDLRISEAKSLLMETSLSCSSIARMVGFDDANYFSRIFKKRIGFSPLQYRRSVIELNVVPY